MHTSQHMDVSAARLLSDLPAFSRWESRPLNRQLKQLIGELDEQTLMSLAAHAVRRITNGATPGVNPGVTAVRRVPV